MSQSPRNTDPCGRDPLGGDVPDFVVSNSTGQTDETATLNQYLYAPGQPSSGYDPYAAGEFPSQRWEDPSRDSVASWVGVVLLMAIPLVNFITVLVMASSSSFSRAKQNFARAILLVIGILVGVMLLIGLMSGAMFYTIRQR